MKLWTTYYHRVQYLPEDWKVFAISRTHPDFFEGFRIFELAPTRELFSIGKGNPDKTPYIDGYREIVLGSLNPDKIAKIVGHNGVLICYEALDKFCHRHLVSQWLRDAGYDCTEWLPGGESQCVEVPQ